MRKSGKQKGNALLADVAQADSKRPAGRGRRRGRGGFADAGRGRGGGPPPPTESADDESRARRRRAANGPKQYEFDDALSAVSNKRNCVASYVLNSSLCRTLIPPEKHPPCRRRSGEVANLNLRLLLIVPEKVPRPVKQGLSMGMNRQEGESPALQRHIGRNLIEVRVSYV